MDGAWKRQARHDIAPAPAGRVTVLDTVLVTGASGFLGGHMIRDLVARGDRVRALVRTPLPTLTQSVTQAKAVTLTDRENVRRSLDGVGTVVHLAARVHVMRETPGTDALDEFRRANVEGTRVLLEESIAAGVRRFLFVSSVKAMSEGGERVLTEEDIASPVDPYGVSKLEAEQVVRHLCDQAGMHAPIVRLPLVYGPGVRANFLRLLELVDRGVPLPFGLVDNRRSLAFTGNVTAAIMRCLDTPVAARETFLVSDGDDLSTPRLVREIAAVLGKKGRLIPVPPVLFRAAGSIGDLLSKLVPGFPLTSAAVHRLLGSLVIDSSKLGRLTGFVPPYSVTEGLEATAGWYRSRTRS